MEEFKIGEDALRREARFRALSLGTILLLMAVTVFLSILRIMGRVAGPDVGLIAMLCFFASFFGAFILACSEALRRAEREMVFVLDDNAIIRRRHGYPDVNIAFSEMETLSEEMRWLIITSAEPRRKIAVPNNVRGYESIRAELAKHHALSAAGKLPLKIIVKSVLTIALSLLSWAAVVWLHNPKAIVIAGAIGLTLLGIGTHRLWILLRSRKKLLATICIGLVWIGAIALIYVRVTLP